MNETENGDRDLIPPPRPATGPAPRSAAGPTPRGTILGIDLGERRIGVAAGDPATGLVTPITTVRRATPDRDARTLRRLCDERRVIRVVVGLPLLLDGSEGSQARHTREWVSRVAPALGRPIAFRDERLTSVAAEERLGPPRRGRSGGPPSPAAREARRAHVDRLAAVAIVQAELDAAIDPSSTPVARA